MLNAMVLIFKRCVKFNKNSLIIIKNIWCRTFCYSRKNQTNSLFHGKSRKLDFAHILYGRIKFVVSRWDLQSLLGIMSFVTACVRPARIFTSSPASTPCGLTPLLVSVHSRRSRTPGMQLWLREIWFLSAFDFEVRADHVPGALMQFETT